ncbi:MAG TPA: hypothetical protein VGZ47_22795 [Gemmataceae bacterium]|jgi:predicted nucleic-acid-binding Zn-ribbon protein|nr:hypothetical protein [Gemmataceae bacterium]
MMPRPLNQGKLSTEEQAKLAQWLKSKQCHCPSCRSDEWDEADCGILKYSSGIALSHPNQNPVIKLTCKRCGYISFFSAFTIGIVGEQLR